MMPTPTTEATAPLPERELPPEPSQPEREPTRADQDAIDAVQALGEHQILPITMRRDTLEMLQEKPEDLNTEEAQKASLAVMAKAQEIGPVTDRLSTIEEVRSAIPPGEDVIAQVVGSFADYEASADTLPADQHLLAFNIKNAQAINRLAEHEPPDQQKELRTGTFIETALEHMDDTDLSPEDVLRQAQDAFSKSTRQYQESTEEITSALDRNLDYFEQDLLGAKSELDSMEIPPVPESALKESTEITAITQPLGSLLNEFSTGDTPRTAQDMENLIGLSNNPQAQIEGLLEMRQKFEGQSDNFIAQNYLMSMEEYGITQMALEQAQERVHEHERTKRAYLESIEEMQRADNLQGALIQTAQELNNREGLNDLHSRIQQDDWEAFGKYAALLRDSQGVAGKLATDYLADRRAKLHSYKETLNDIAPDGHGARPAIQAIARSYLARTHRKGVEEKDVLQAELRGLGEQLIVELAA